MAIWTYDDYITLDGAARLTELRLHIQEVSQKIRPDMNSAPGGVSTGSVAGYLETLKAEERELTRALSSSRSQFVRGRPV